MGVNLKVHEHPLAQFGDRAGGFRQLRYPNAIVIPLTQGQFAIVDQDVYTRVSGYRWMALKIGNTYYAATNVPTPEVRYVIRNGRICEHQKTTLLLLHTLITGWSLVDHENGNGLDCRSNNMREATSAQNRANQINLRSDNKSGHTGISWDKARNKWRIQAGSGLNKVSKRFAEFDDAVQAYHNAMERIYGEFAPKCCEKELTENGL